jgi:hypothetical protein
MNKANKVFEMAKTVEKSVPDLPGGAEVDGDLADFLSEILGIDIETVKKRLSNANVNSLKSFVDGVKGLYKSQLHSRG